MKVSRKTAWFVLCLLVIGVDQASKYWASASLTMYQTKAVLPFFNLTLAHNKGAAFSFLSSASGWQNLFFIAIACLVSVILVIWLYRLKQNERLEAFAIALILGGAWGNVLDRLQYGFVVDFLDFHIAGHHWPVFNIADSAICVGAGIILLSSFMRTS